ncbi:unnamed protein product [Effrenium voratum]|uniref:Uncharacterized protein n=1 Tax=Effrenium voratum TaxID=2562239 RepID=A0AA36NIH8_9DINO|nr:unnamed protein product [Effrenium voratum]CAJ1422117.1 unnamed protein product [Effrenium voratum]
MSLTMLRLSLLLAPAAAMESALGAELATLPWVRFVLSDLSSAAHTLQKTLPENFLQRGEFAMAHRRAKQPEEATAPEGSSPRAALTQEVREALPVQAQPGQPEQPVQPEAQPLQQIQSQVSQLPQAQSQVLPQVQPQAQPLVQPLAEPLVEQAQQAQQAQPIQPQQQSQVEQAQAQTPQVQQVQPVQQEAPQPVQQEAPQPAQQEATGQQQEPQPAQLPQAEQVQQVPQAADQSAALQSQPAPQVLASQSAAKKITPATRYAATFSLALLVKVMCMLSNVACHVSPFPQVQQFHKNHDTGEADAAPLMSILYSGAQWVFYGTFAFYMTGKSGFLVLVYANITGAVLGSYYIWGFQRNCRDKKALEQLRLYLRVAALMVSLQMLAILFLTSGSALFLSGLMSSLSSIIGAFSLCSTLPKVIKTQCSASINLELLVVSIGSSVLWVSCGVMLWDVWILLPTLFCLVIQLICGVFVLLFPREEQGDLIHLPSRSPLCTWVMPRSERDRGVPLSGRAHAAAAQIRAALAATAERRDWQDYGSTAGAGTGGTC